MPTPKSLRVAPDRIFENYILTLTTDSSIGLLKVPQEKFSHVPGPPGNSGNDDDTSDPLDIGFAFKFDGVTYHQYMVSTNGWVILVDPATPGGTSNGTIINDVMVNTYTNSRINSVFTRNHALFAVWFDDLRNTYSSPQSLGLTPEQIDLYEKGLSQPDKKINPRKYGVQYFLEKNSNEGRRLIIRWNCVSDYSIPNSILNFDFVLYENGKIEYRYAQRDSIGASTANEDATIGVFMPGSSNRFRDFSYELDYGVQRQRYKFGGAIYDATYSDTADGYTVPYGVGLKPSDYWPGQKNAGCIFTFQPPLNRRKVLPRQTLRERDSRLTLPMVARTGDSRSGNSNIIFDDRKSIVYRSSGLVINYPSTLPRFYAPETFGVTENQDLFSGEFVVTGGISKSNVQDYLADNQKSYIAPFTENKLFENDPGSDTDPFFTVGSSTKDVGKGFSQSLKSKTQIRLSFRVDHKTTMFGASSSIYYFNSKTSRWQYPTASFVNGQFDIANPFGDAAGLRLTEVDRGFNAFGFNISSGSLSSRSSLPYSTDGVLGGIWNKDDEINSLIKEYQKSIQVDQRYSANSDESFAVPINQPFLLEKAVIEFPIEAGPGWFNDKTKCFIPIISGTTLTNGSPSLFALYSTTTYPNYAFDIGGPGLTIGLYNQISVGPNKTRRDLILSGTITHQFDNTAEIVYSNSPDLCLEGNVWQVVPQGFKAYGTPTAVVNGNLGSGTNYFFTGSVKLKCQSEVSNGTLIRDTVYINQSYQSAPSTVLFKDYTTGSLEMLFNDASWKVKATGGGEVFNPISYLGYIGGYRFRYLSAVNNLGRGAAGFQPSGRSILGKEYVTTQGMSDKFSNPFYLYKDANILSNLKSIVTNNPTNAQWFYATSLINKSTSKPSPYLLFPGDKLVLSISKSRPVFFSTKVSSPYTSGSIQHDIKLTTGSINITLYGSLIANGQEFHDTLNQPLASDSIHEVVIGETKTW
jgi:hypothetical protein